jgi:hypothetical protein
MSAGGIFKNRGEQEFTRGDRSGHSFFITCAHKISLKNQLLNIH